VYDNLEILGFTSKAHFWHANTTSESTGRLRISRSSDPGEGHGSNEAKNAGGPPLIKMQSCLPYACSGWEHQVA